MLNQISQIQQNINAFRSLSESNYIFACQAAVPLVLTPDFLYQLWINFKTYQYIDEPETLHKISHIAISDLLLSTLCQEVGYELFEMEKQVRDTLLQDLVMNLGERRRNTIAAFLQDYSTVEYLGVHHKNLRDIHQLTASSILDPVQMERQIIEKINQAASDADKINYLLLHHNLLPADYQSELHKISSLVTDSEKAIFSPVLIEESNGSSPGVLRFDMQLPSILQDRIQRVPVEQPQNEANTIKVLEVVEQCYQLKSSTLDLSEFLLTDEDFAPNAPFGIRLSHCQHLTHLVVKGDERLSLFPEVITELKKLNILRIGGKKDARSAISYLPINIDALRELTLLDLSYNSITEFPAVIFQLQKLKKLKINGNQLRAIPDNISVLTNLQEFNVSDNYIDSLPKSLLHLSKLRKFWIQNNPVSLHLPNEILYQSAQDLLNALLKSPSAQEKKKINVFISYSHEDREFFKEFKLYLNEKKCPHLNFWSNEQNHIESRWDETIKKHISEAQIILILVSQSYLDLESIYNREFFTVLERYKQKRCVVIPIFVRPCILEPFPEIKHLQGLPKDGRFLSQMRDRNQTLIEITREINGLADEFLMDIDTNSLAESFDNKSRGAIPNFDLLASKKIFLSVPDHPEARRQRNELISYAIGKSKYEGWPYEIVPGMKEAEETEYMSDKERLKIFSSLIGESIYSIHILFNEDDLKKGINKLQYDLAKGLHPASSNAVFRSIIWLMREDLTYDVTKEQQKDIILYGDNEEMIFQQIEKLDKEKENGNSKTKTVYMIYDYAKDRYNEVRISLKTKLENNGITVLDSSMLGGIGQTFEKDREFLTSGLKFGDGVIIFYGNAEVYWFSLMQALVIEFAESSKIPVAVFVDEPDVEKKIHRDISRHFFSSIITKENFDEEVKKISNLPYNE